MKPFWRFRQTNEKQLIFKIKIYEKRYINTSEGKCPGASILQVIPTSRLCLWNGSTTVLKINRNQ